MADIIDITTRRPKLFGAAPPNPDGEAIWRCNQLIAITHAIEDAHKTIQCEQALDAALASLDRRWRDVQDQLAALPLPTTREGVRATARMMTTFCALNGEWAEEQCCPLWVLLSRACAEYLAGRPG